MPKVATAVLEIKTDTGQVKGDLGGLEQVGKKVSQTFQQQTSLMSKGFSDFGSHVRQVQGLVNDFSGQKAIQEAHAVAKAVQEIGGAAKLSAAQQQQVSSVMSAALQAHKARGDEASASIKNLAAQTKSASAEGRSFTSVLGKANGALAAFGASVSIAAAVGFGKQVLEDAAAFQDLHEATDISVQDLQRLKAVGSDVGVDIGETTQAVGKLADRIASGDKSAVGAIGMLGLSVKKLQDAGPMEAFLQITEAAGRIEDPMIKNALASDLFGDKLGKKLIPLLGQLRQKMADVPKDELFSDQDVEDADRLTEAIGHLITKLEAYSFRAARAVLNNKGLFDKDLADIQRQVEAARSGVLPSRSTTPTSSRMTGGGAIADNALTQTKLLENELKRLRSEAMEPLSATQKQWIRDLQKWGESESEIAKLVRASESSVHQYTERLKEGQAAAKKQAEENKRLAEAIDDVISHATRWYELIQTVDGAVVEGAKYYIERGASLQKVAQMYALTEGQIEAIAESMKFEQTMIDATGESYAQLTKRLGDTLKARLDLSNAGFSKNLATDIAAQQNAIDIRNKQSMSAFDFQVSLIKREAEERRRSLDPKASGYSDALQAIADETDAKMGEASRAWQEHVQDMELATASWANATRSFLQSVPGLIQSAFAGGGGLTGGLKAIGSNLGASLFGEKGPLGFAAGGLMNGLGNKLTGLFGTAFGLALPGIGTALGSLIGPLINKIMNIGGPSKQELAGRKVVEDFEKQFENTADMINKVGEAYRANGKSAADAQAAIQRLWAAEKQGAEATKKALEEINELLKRTSEIDAAISGQGFKSQDQIRHEADIANAAYEKMLQSGQYTQAQVEEAYRHYQELLAQLEGAAGDAARAWLKAHQAADDAVDASSDAMKSAEDDLKALIDKRDALSKDIAQEAPEAEMGAIEKGMRAQRDALDDQIQQQADAYAKLAEETGENMADAIREALERLNIKINIGYNLPPFDPSQFGYDPNRRYDDHTNNGATHEAAGDWLHVTRPRTFIAGEAGPEDVAFGGAGRDLAKDVAAALGPMLAGRGDMPPIIVTVKSILDGREIASSTHRVWDHNVNGLRTEAQEILGVR